MRCFLSKSCLVLFLAGAQSYGSGLPARVTFHDGTVRSVTLEGVGCTVSVCARWQRMLNSLADIKEITGRDALLTMRDGTRRRQSLGTDFRVLYLDGPHGGTEKLDLSSVTSVQFSVPAP